MEGLGYNEAIIRIGVRQAEHRCGDGGFQTCGYNREAGKGRCKPIGGATGGGHSSFFNQSTQSNDGEGGSDDLSTGGSF